MLRLHFYGVTAVMCEPRKYYDEISNIHLSTKIAA